MKFIARVNSGELGEVSIDVVNKNNIRVFGLMTVWYVSGNYSGDYDGVLISNGDDYKEYNSISNFFNKDSTWNYLINNFEECENDENVKFLLKNKPEFESLEFDNIKDMKNSFWDVLDWALEEVKRKSTKFIDGIWSEARDSLTQAQEYFDKVDTRIQNFNSSFDRIWK